MLSAKDIANRYAGQIVKCKVTTSPAVTDAAGNVLDTFDAKIVGWKLPIIGKEPSYVCVEVLSPGITKTILLNFLDNYRYTVNRNKKGFGKKLLPEEIILPIELELVHKEKKDETKAIPEWPDKCRDCSQPAVIMATQIDCSNPLCKNKFRTHSGLDLFLPVAFRPPGWEKDPFRKRRNGVDDEDFVICTNCKARSNNGTFVKDKIGTFKASCPQNHTWIFQLNIGDKLNAQKVMIYKGKNIFVPFFNF